MRRRRGAAADLWLVAALLVVCAIADAVAPPRPPHAEAFIGFFVAIASAVMGFFRVMGGTVIPAAVRVIVYGLRTSIVTLSRVIARGIQTAGIWTAKAFSALKRFAVGFGRSAWDYVKGIWWHLRAALTTIFGPIISFLQALRARVWDIYTKYFRPIVDTIHFVQQLLRGLAWLGVDWAARLDGKLTQIVTYINEPFDFLIGKINEALGWVNRIVTGGGLLQRVMLINSTWRDIRYITAQWWRAQHRPLTEEQRTQYTTVKPIHPNTEVDGGALTEWARHRSGPLAPKIREFGDMVRINATIVRRL